MKTSKIFLDTNFLFYLYSKQDVIKQNKALDWLTSHKAAQFYISIQVQKELYVALTRKLKMDKLEVRALIQKTNNLNVIVNTSEQIERAMELNILHSLSFFDSLIFAAAEFAQCDILATEDMQSSFRIKGLEIMNPLE